MPSLLLGAARHSHRAKYYCEVHATCVRHCRGPNEPFIDNASAKPSDSLAVAPQVPRALMTAQPESFTILPTYRCNAACRECCFESHPGIKHA